MVYTWKVPDRAGPGPNDPSSLVWLYHGHFFEPASVNLGSVGAIIITGAGKARDSSTYDGLMPTVLLSFPCTRTFLIELVRMSTASLFSFQMYLMNLKAISSFPTHFLVTTWILSTSSL